MKREVLYVLMLAVIALCVALAATPSLAETPSSAYDLSGSLGEAISKTPEGTGMGEIDPNAPEGFEDNFGTYRLCLQFVSDHWYMHRGQLADARRAAGLERMWL